MSAPRSDLERFGVIGFNHRRLPARLRGALDFDDDWCADLATRLRNAQLADGVAFVSTCNRQEVLISAQHPAFALELIRAQLHSRLASVDGSPQVEPYRHVGEEAVRHVLRVSASLDSLVVGERQITQQLRRSFDRARGRGWLDKPLNGLARISIENAKAIHARTALGSENVGLFSLTRDLLLRELGGGERPRIAVVGLGEIGLKTARALAETRRFELTLSSRTARTAAALGTTLSALPFVALERLPELLATQDAVVLATGAPGAIVDEALLRAAARTNGHPLVLVDLGIPPQVDVVCQGVAGARLFNLDWFSSTGFGQKPAAREALRQAQGIVEEGVVRLGAWTRTRRHAQLFDQLVTLAQQHKGRAIPDVIRAKLPTLAREQQRAVADAMHDLLTDYADSVFAAVNSALAQHDDTPQDEPNVEESR